MKQKITSIIVKAINGLQKEGVLKSRSLPQIVIEKPRVSSFGDYSSNVSMLMAKEERRSPADLAKMIASKIGEIDAGNLFREVGAAAPGFINLTLDEKFLSKSLAEVMKFGERYGRIPGWRRNKVLLEYVSANPTGPLHVGHGRWAVIGDVLSSILDFAGSRTEREYYVNDVGRQIDLLEQSVIARSRGEDVPKDGYGGEYVSEIAEKLKDKLKGKHLARDIMELMLAEQRKVLSKLGVRFDRWFYESSLHKQKRIEGIIKELSKRGVTFEEEGALWFKSKELGDDKNRVLVREDGASTYFASDIAYHVDKFRRKYDLLINVWGTDHHGYVARLKAAVKFLGFPVEKLKIIIGQLVSLFRAGEPVKMSKRAGEMVTLEEVIDEIGVDATRFFFLMTSPDTHLDFDLELAKKHSSDNPVYYVQYAHARISSILREAEKSGHNIKKAVRTADLELLNDPEEIILIKKIVSFPDEILESARALLPHRLINYSRELSAQFHNFYHKLRVLSSDQDLTRSRLALVFATRIVLRNVLKLLGISAPESM